jgi:FkbM family methyltransferase
LKIISVLHFPEFGGPHNQMLRLTAPLAERGVDSLAVLPEGAGAERLRAGHVPIEIIELGRVRAVRDLRVQALMIARFPRDLWALVQLFRREQPDVVILSGLMNPHGAIAARLLGIPVLWQLLDTRPPMPLRRIMMRPIRWLSDALMPVGHRVAEAHPGSETFGDRMVIFYPPVDTQTFRPRPGSDRPLRADLGITPDAPVVGVIGNINPQKGHEHFAAAAAIVHQAIPNAKFVIAGHIYPNHRAYYDSLLARATAGGLVPGEDIFYLGPRDDIPEVLASIDVLALASVPNSEGTPTVILEAMACGLPVVATDVGAVREVVADGETGYVVPALQPASMAACLQTLLTDPDRSAAFGQAARQRVEQEFSLEACVNAHLRAFAMARAHRGRHSHEDSPPSMTPPPAPDAPRLASIKRLGRKAAHVAPLVARNPRLLPLMRQGVHPEHYTRLNGAWLQQGNFRTVLDIGANTGQFALTVRAMLPDATIYAFEPQDECYLALQESFAGLPRLHAMRTAVGDEDGEITFHRNAFSQSSSVLEMSDLHKETFPWATTSQDITVPIHRLDSLRGQVTIEPALLVKIDVQGYEDRVLRGGAEVIRQAAAVLIETSFAPLYTGEASFAGVYAQMTGLGFRFAGNLDQVANPATSLPLYADALFVREP